MSNTVLNLQTHFFRQFESFSLKMKTLKERNIFGNGEFFVSLNEAHNKIKFNDF